MFYSRKIENVYIPLKGACAKIYAKFLRKNCTIYFHFVEDLIKSYKMLKFNDWKYLIDTQILKTLI